MLNKRTALVFFFFCIFALAAPPAAVDAGQTTANGFDSSYFHFRYEFPKNWLALDDKVRLAENKERYDKQLKDALQRNGPNTQTHTTEVFSPYTLLVAGRTAVISSDTGQVPRVMVQATKRLEMMMDPGDPAKLIAQVMRPKVLRGPEEIILSGHKFVRADFQFRPDSFLSKFATVSGDYLIEFDLRAANEKDLAELASTMQTIKFSDY